MTPENEKRLFEWYMARDEVNESYLQIISAAKIPFGGELTPDRIMRLKQLSMFDEFLTTARKLRKEERELFALGLIKPATEQDIERLRRPN